MDYPCLVITSTGSGLPVYCRSLAEADRWAKDHVKGYGGLATVYQAKAQWLPGAMRVKVGSGSER